MDNILRAYSRLVAIKGNLPKSFSIHEKYIKEYHEIVDLLAKEAGTSLDEFKIPEREAKRSVTSFLPDIPSIGQESRRTYSEDRYCERPFFMSKLDALLSYFQIRYLNQESPKIGFEPPNT